MKNKITKYYKENATKIWMISIPVLVVALLIWSVNYSKNTKIEMAEKNTPSILEVKSDDYKKGALNGKVVLVEYLDFECEGCKAFYPILKDLQKDFPNDLTIVNRYFPLGGHKNSMTAALAVEASARQGKYYEMHDKMFETQDTWGNKGMADPTIFLPFAKEIGLDMNKYSEDVKSESAKSRVERDVKEGNTLGNTGTPSFYLQGKKMENIKSYEDLKSRVQTEIDKLK
jgi:protein-disulfide isomerase